MSFRDMDWFLMYVMLQLCFNGKQANTTIPIPRICGRQTQRFNISAKSPSEYYRLNIYLPFEDSLNQQLSLRFNDLTHKAEKTLNFLPSNLDQQTIESILELF
ncbi:hypothetical protein KUTeg_022503, partial [Tegillarca granosa]